MYTHMCVKFKLSCTIVRFDDGTKGGQVTKPIIVVKVPCKLLYVIQVKEFLLKCSTSWPYLISEFLVAYITIVASDWPRTFFTLKVFLFSISLLFVRDSKKIL